MTFLSDLVEKDGWRKFTFAIWITSLGFIAMMWHGRMSGDAFGTMAGATMFFLAGGEVAAQAVKQNAATKQAQATAGVGNAGQTGS